MKKLAIIFTLILSGFNAFSQPYKRPVTLNPNSGYVSINELTTGYGLGSTEPDYSQYFFGFTTTHGYQVNFYGLDVKNILKAGAGTGVLYYNGGMLFPVYGDIRFAGDKRRVTPFIFARSGILVSIDDFNGNTRMFINAGGGLRFRIDEHISINIGPGIFLQMGSSVSRDAFIDLKAGVAFKPR